MSVKITRKKKETRFFVKNEISFEDLKMNKVLELNRKADLKMERLLAKYPKVEVDSFFRKEEEARLFLNNSEADVPYLEELVGGDRNKLPALVEAILSKANYAAREESYLVSLREKILSATDEEMLASIEIEV